MHTIEYIKANGLQSLNRDFGIEIAEYPDRVSLNYNMIDSPKFHPIVIECRGLILRKPITEKSEWKVLARSFDRFFNYTEGEESYQKEQRALLHHRDLVILEKVDGSLCSVYHDNGNRWNIATRKMAMGEGKSALGNTFCQIFERAIGASISERFKEFDINFTYVFELVSLETRVVTPYPKDDVYLLAIRDRRAENGYKEVPWSQAKEFAQKTDSKLPRNTSFILLPILSNQ